MFRHQSPADTRLDGDHRKRVSDDIVQLVGDPHSLFPYIIAGPLNLSRPLPLCLRGESRHVLVPRCNAVPDELRGDERQESLDRLGREGNPTGIERRVDKRDAEGRRHSNPGANRHPSRQLGRHKVGGQPE